MELKEMFETPINGFLTLLTLYTIITILFHINIDTIIHLIIVGFIFGVAYFISDKYTSMRVNWKNFAISAMIAFLIIHPSKSVENMLILAVVAIAFVLGKMLRYNNMPIFNPIVFALLLSTIILELFSRNAFVSWWGAAWQGSLSLLFLAPVVIWNLMKFRRYYLFGSFIIVTAVLFSFKSLSSLEFMLTTGTLYFLAGIMLLEIKTSPVKMKQQLIFGVIAAVAFFAISSAGISHSDLWGIAIANASLVGMKFLKI